MDRRRFLRVGGGGLAVVFAALSGCGIGSGDDPSAAVPGLVTDPDRGGYGPLSRAGDELALPPGFEYRVLSVEGAMMTDGFAVPGRHDGMAAFAGAEGAIRLVRNHELDGAAGARPDGGYDPAGGGGTTTLVVDPETRELIEDRWSLTGTVRNCAGGPTPWGTWLSAEETLDGRDQGYERSHGYVFEVAVDADEPVDARPLTGLGRFRHEATAVDLDQDLDLGVVYLTEDADPEAGFYRFVATTGRAPADGSLDLEAGGRLQALAVVDVDGVDLRSEAATGRWWSTRWVDVADPDPDPDSGTSVFAQAREAGAAAFRRLEGISLEGPTVWFTSTDGGRGRGQIWRYEPAATDTDTGGVLTLMHVPTDGAVLDGPDNLVVSPQGSVVICEDNGRSSQRLVALTPAGLLVPLAANIGDGSELAGATFSPDGRTLFVNTQGTPGPFGSPARTLAVWGPWAEGAV